MLEEEDRDDILQRERVVTSKNDLINEFSAEGHAIYVTDIVNWFMNLSSLTETGKMSVILSSNIFFF